MFNRKIRNESPETVEIKKHCSYADSLLTLILLEWYTVLVPWDRCAYFKDYYEECTNENQSTEGR